MEDRGRGGTPDADNRTANCTGRAEKDGQGRRQGDKGGAGRDLYEAVQ